MKRRRFLAAAPAALAAPYLGGVLGSSLLSACGGQPLTGPVEIKWDRDVCARCSMVISDRLFAAQARDPNKKVHKFDDIGCLVFYLEHQTWQPSATEIWVADSRDGRWLAGRDAHYVPGKRTPMGYGFGAVAEAGEGALAWEPLRRAVLAKGK